MRLDCGRAKIIRQTRIATNRKDDGGGASTCCLPSIDRRANSLSKFKASDRKMNVRSFAQPEIGSAGAGNVPGVGGRWIDERPERGNAG